MNGNGNNGKKKRRRVIIWGSVVAVIVLLIAVGVIVAKSGGTKIDPSKLAKVEKGDLAKSVVATGKVTPAMDPRLSGTDVIFSSPKRAARPAFRWQKNASVGRRKTFRWA